MTNLIAIDGEDLSDEIHKKIKDNHFVGIVRHQNGDIELLKSKINAEEAVYLLSMAIKNILEDDCID